ncbi:uncharacterized protein [Argopecten irradians]|uniref:uncharacterized protein n=1 Tax=Argopecten irradians TaxID=31199 RepID=UPI003714BDD6
MKYTVYCSCCTYESCLPYSVHISACRHISYTADKTTGCRPVEMKGFRPEVKDRKSEKNTLIRQLARNGTTPQPFVYRKKDILNYRAQERGHASRERHVKQQFTKQLKPYFNKANEDVSGLIFTQVNALRLQNDQLDEEKCEKDYIEKESKVCDQTNSNNTKSILRKAQVRLDFPEKYESETLKTTASYTTKISGCIVPSWLFQYNQPDLKIRVPSWIFQYNPQHTIFRPQPQAVYMMSSIIDQHIPPTEVPRDSGFQGSSVAPDEPQTKTRKDIFYETYVSNECGGERQTVGEDIEKKWNEVFEKEQPGIEAIADVDNQDQTNNLIDTDLAGDQAVEQWQGSEHSNDSMGVLSNALGSEHSNASMGMSSEAPGSEHSNVSKGMTSETLETEHGNVGSVTHSAILDLEWENGIVCTAMQSGETNQPQPMQSNMRAVYKDIHDSNAIPDAFLFSDGNNQFLETLVDINQLTDLNTDGNSYGDGSNDARRQNPALSTPNSESEYTAHVAVHNLPDRRNDVPGRSKQGPQSRRMMQRTHACHPQEAMRPQHAEQASSLEANQERSAASHSPLPQCLQQDPLIFDSISQGNVLKPAHDPGERPSRYYQVQRDKSMQAASGGQPATDLTRYQQAQQQQGQQHKLEQQQIQFQVQQEPHFQLNLPPLNLNRPLQTQAQHHRRQDAQATPHPADLTLSVQPEERSHPGFPAECIPITQNGNQGVVLLEAGHQAILLQQCSQRVTGGNHDLARQFLIHLVNGEFTSQHCGVIVCRKLQSALDRAQTGMFVSGHKGQYIKMSAEGSGGYGVVHRCQTVIVNGTGLEMVEFVRKRMPIRSFHEQEAMVYLDYGPQLPNTLEFLGIVKNYNYIDMFLEYAAGGSLVQWIQCRPNLDIMDSVGKDIIYKQMHNIVYHILCRTADFNRHNLAHRDIKAGNVLFKNKDRSGSSLVLADTGTTKSWEDIQRSGISILDGTPIFCAPEYEEVYTCPDNGRDFELCDGWETGATCFHVVTGQPLWAREKHRFMGLYGERNYRKHLRDYIVSEGWRICELINDIDQSQHPLATPLVMVISCLLEYHASRRKTASEVLQFTMFSEMRQKDIPHTANIPCPEVIPSPEDMPGQFPRFPENPYSKLVVKFGSSPIYIKYFKTKEGLSIHRLPADSEFQKQVEIHVPHCQNGYNLTCHTWDTKRKEYVLMNVRRVYRDVCVYLKPL